MQERIALGDAPTSSWPRSRSPKITDRHFAGILQVEVEKSNDGINAAGLARLFVGPAYVGGLIVE
jgi:hypothetical protein